MGLTEASPVNKPTFLAPNSLTSWKNFSVTKALRGAVYHAACEFRDFDTKGMGRESGKSGKCDGSVGSGSTLEFARLGHVSARSRKSDVNRDG